MDNIINNTRTINDDLTAVIPNASTKFTLDYTGDTKTGNNTF